MDARTASSGSSVWEGQLQSLVLSEYASTEMSLHALYMHQVSGQLKTESRVLDVEKPGMGSNPPFSPVL